VKNDKSAIVFFLQLNRHMSLQLSRRCRYIDPGRRLSINAAPHPLQTLFSFPSKLSSTISVEPQATRVRIAVFICSQIGIDPDSNAPINTNRLLFNIAHVTGHECIRLGSRIQPRTEPKAYAANRARHELLARMNS
jgi:hypothetical protein